MLKNKKLILASQLPRRKDLLAQMGFEFEIRLNPVDETPPADLPIEALAEYLAQKKAHALRHTLTENEILLSADTVVIKNGVSLAKAQNATEAKKMLSQLSAQVHQVQTGVCLLSKNKEICRSEITEVHFRELSTAEIDFYIQNYAPFDKAGAYGIQEWIGMVGIKKIVGSYFNVVGLPTHLVYEMLQEMD